MKKRKNKFDINSYPLVQIKWLDIQSDSSWLDIDELLKQELPVCISKGHLLTRFNGITRIFADYNLKENTNEIQDISNASIIPNSVIIEIKKI